MSFTGNLTFGPCKLRRAALLTAEHFVKAGYETTTFLYGKEIEGIDFGKGRKKGEGR